MIHMYIHTLCIYDCIHRIMLCLAKCEMNSEQRILISYGLFVPCNPNQIRGVYIKFICKTTGWLAVWGG